MGYYGNLDGSSSAAQVGPSGTSGPATLEQPLKLTVRTRTVQQSNLVVYGLYIHLWIIIDVSTYDL